tara:strand:- start:609 stop:1130 length:522 start_codon:yes stop_codon:yes gene_type:complete
MGIFTRLGNKIADGIHSVARVGKKITGNVSRVGHKIASVGKSVVGAIERVPVIGQALAPVTGIARSAIGLVEDVADAAGGASKLMGTGAKLIRAGQSAVNKGDVSGAKEVLRSAGNLGIGGKAQQNIQKARQAIGSAKSLAGMAGGAVGESKANLMKNVVQAREAARASTSFN